MRKRHLLLTRSAEQNERDRQLIDESRYHVHSVPLIETKGLNVQQEPVMLAEAQWIFFTSSNAAHYFFKTIDTKGDLSGKKVAVIGKMTAEEVYKHHPTIDFMPSEYTSDIFIKEWQAQEGQQLQRILLPKSDLARSNIMCELRIRGHVVTEQIVYENCLPASSAERLRELVTTKALEIAFFSSPSAWQRFCEVVQEIPSDLLIGAIGPVTQQAIRRSGKESIIPANQRFMMADLIETMLNTKSQSS